MWWKRLSVLVMKDGEVLEGDECGRSRLELMLGYNTFLGQAQSREIRSVTDKLTLFLGQFCCFSFLYMRARLSVSVVIFSDLHYHLCVTAVASSSFLRVQIITRPPSTTSS